MASENTDKINETLYTDSYFRLLRSKNNLSEAGNEFRRLIMQSDMHCSTLNMSKQNIDDLKSQLSYEYSSLIDNKHEDGLLPVINDDFDSEKWLSSSMESNCDIALNKAKQYCMEHVQKRLTSLKLNFSNEIQTIKSSTFASSSCDSKNISMSCGSQNLHNLELKKNICGNKDTFNKGQNLFLMSNDNKCKSTNSSNNKANIQHFKHSDSMSSGVAFKRRAAEIDNSTSFSSKRSNKNYSNKTEDPPENSDKIKNNFMTASSMYKNPLKKACKKKENVIESETFDTDSESDIKNHPSLKNFDPKIVTIILSEIMDFSPDIKWSDIAGLEFVKNTVQEIVIWPLLRPDIFTGLRAPPKGILLFGPPGTGKTLIGKCIATESNSTFFCISASSLASKWVGESEQLVRALFAVAQLHQPAVIFIDEIDSLLSQRSDQEQDHTRKLKTEFLVQFDGAKTTSERRILVVGATNRPHELDEAARRRFVKRLYVPLPVEDARLQIIEKLLSAHQHNLSTSDLKKICEETKGYSGSDVAHLCKEAAMGPIRSIGPELIKTVSLDQVRSIELIDFLDALRQVRASVAEEDLNYYLDWNKKFGSFSA